jgi:hypothetical protein
MVTVTLEFQRTRVLFHHVFYSNSNKNKNILTNHYNRNRF